MAGPTKVTRSMTGLAGASDAPKTVDETAGATLEIESGAAPTRVRLVGAGAARDPAPSGEEPSSARYDVGERIGEGGMGEVHACVDRRIGREVARKRLRPEADTPELRERFLREGRVQGQLEHPSVVPVYDLGHDEHGSAYLTMKRVRGETLEQVLDALRADPAGAAARRHTRHKLLTAFATVCLGVHYAHAAGVVHRDLKPANIMLGHFGEVYVLDWGVAKLASEPAAPASRPPVAPRVSDPATSGTPTQRGSILGTPGYMSPEQCAGDVEAVDARADVYALGAILFEILTLEPLHGAGRAAELLTRTLKGSDARASVRAPARGIDPELDAICVKATALLPEQRFATALELHDAFEAVLSGHRDVERRRELAAGHARAALEAADRALATSTSGAAQVEETRRAMREISRAVALDPENRDALATLVRLFTHPPDRIPREAKEGLATVHAQSQRVGARTAALAYASVLLYAPLAIWMGLRDLALCAVYLLLWVAAAGASVVAGKARPRWRWTADAAIVASNAALALGTAMLGPLVMIPAMTAVNTMSFVVSGDRRRRALVIALGCLTVVGPLLLEALGVLPASMIFRDGGIFIPARALELPRAATLTFLAAAAVGSIVTGSVVVARFRDALVKTEQRLYFHTWLLRQFLPDRAYADVVPGTSTSVPSLRAR